MGLNVFQSSTTATGETYLYSSRTPVVSKSTQYTFSCDLYANNLVKSIDVFWLSDTDATQKTGSGYVNVTSKSHTPTLRNGWYHYTWTFTTKADDRTGYIRIDNNGSSTEGSTAILKAANLKLEKGSKETGYSRSMSEMHFSPADDCSGYNNNGTASGTFNLDTDTPRYSMSSIFSGSNYITATHSMDGTNATISAWVKVNSYPTANSIILADKSTNIALSFYGNNSILSCGDGNNTTRTATGLKDKWDTTKWNHMVVVKKGSTYTFYLNGVEWTAQGGTYGSNNYWTHTPANELLISGRHNGSTHEHKFTGNVSDVRIYCTALSAEDIKTLYETAGSVTKEGGLIVYEFKEQLNHLTKMKKTGVFMAEDFSERSQLSDMKFTTLSDGSAWARVFYHKTNTGATLFTSIDEVLYTTSEYKYSRLKFLPFLKGSDGKYEFMLTYPTDDPGKYNRWKQTNAPQNEFVAIGDGSAFAAGY
ncbi:MAG: LamG domain-containing protein [Methanobrevibacter sp.]|nr:LamG domain-containing protein [Methanobrevibacter sp.]